jgi:uncharacterized protein YebE (UPF0316 family)
MPYISALPIWGVATLIFFLRIVDVSIGTVRTISVVHGRVTLAVFMGFFELLIWTAAVSQVILGLSEHPLLIVAYAGGYAVGNAVGITIERRLAIGSCVVRMLSDSKGAEVAAALRAIGQHVTSFLGEGSGGLRTLVYATCPRRDLPALLDAARHVDPTLFYAVERFSETSALPVVVAPTGWRAVLKKK